jgi:RND family efflux transporter MFP subunit
MAGVILDPENATIPLVATSLEKNEIVLRLLMLPPGKDLLASKDSLESAQNRYALAVKKAERAKQLLKEGAGSVRSQEETERELEDSRVGLRLAKSLANLMDHQDFKTSEFTPLEIGAPINGIIQNLHVAPGQRVSAGSVLFQMAAQNALWVRLPVYTGLLNQFDADQSVNVRNISSSPHSPGISANPVNAPPSGNPLTASVNLFYELPDGDRTYQAGQKVAVTLKLTGMKKALVVPRSAVVYDINGGTWVYLNPKGNEFVRSRVELQSVMDGWAILTRGPAVGTNIVSSGAAELFGTEFGSGK